MKCLTRITQTMSCHLITCQLSGADTAIHRLVHHIYILRPNFGKRAAIYTDVDALNHTSALHSLIICM